MKMRLFPELPLAVDGGDMPRTKARGQGIFT